MEQFATHRNDRGGRDLFFPQNCFRILWTSPRIVPGPACCSTPTLLPVLAGLIRTSVRLPTWISRRGSPQGGLAWCHMSHAPSFGHIPLPFQQRIGPQILEQRT